MIDAQVRKIKLWAFTSFSGVILGLGMHSGNVAVLSLGVVLFILDGF